jgi:flagella basal body P-ring formation protein FlgA
MTKLHDIMILPTMLLLIVVQAAPAVNPRVRIRAAASVGHGAVRLTDIADVVTDDIAAKMQLDSIVVGNMQPGQTEMSLDLAQVNEALRAAGIIAPSVDVYGSNQCLLGFEAMGRQVAIKPRAVENVLTSIVAPAQSYDLSGQLNKTVAQLLGRGPERFVADWSCARNPELLHESAENGRFEIRPSSSVHLLGRTYFDVVDTSAPGRDGVSPVVFRVKGNVQYLCESVIATTALRSGHVVTSDDIKLLARRVSSFREAGITDENLVLGRKLVRGVAANETISHSMLRQVELIKRNDIVKVTTIVNRVEVAMYGIAKGSGGLGDSILVSYGPDTDAVRGRVTGSGCVTVGGDGEDMRMAVSTLNNHSQTNRLEN